MVGPRRVRIDLRPRSPRDLADIDIAVRIDGESMGGQELAELGPRWCLAKAADQISLMINDADPRSEVGDVAANRGSGADLADIEDRLVAIRHEEATGTMQVLPLRFELTVAVEHLDAVVFAVGDINPAVGIATDVVDDVELALTGPGSAPRHEQLAVGRVFVDAGIAIPVRHVNLALRR